MRIVGKDGCYLVLIDAQKSGEKVKQLLKKMCFITLFLLPECNSDSESLNDLQYVDVVACLIHLQACYYQIQHEKIT